MWSIAIELRDSTGAETKIVRRFGYTFLQKVMADDCFNELVGTMEDYRESHDRLASKPASTETFEYKK